MREKEKFELNEIITDFEVQVSVSSEKTDELFSNTVF
jgi:hypothetical protein